MEQIKALIKSTLSGAQEKIMKERNSFGAAIGVGQRITG